ncbi:hypothetical protein CKO08_12865, partial [Halorhodospira halochloris]|nr:hypothetical protein [Halorhodospira halochloris]
MLPTVDLSDIADTLTHAGEDMVRACEESRVLIEPAPQTLIQGFLALIDTLRASDAELPHQRGEDLRRVTGAEPDALLAHGLELLGMLVLSAQRLGL